MNKVQDLLEDLIEQSYDVNEKKYTPVKVDFKTLKKYRVDLEPEEREKVLKSRAIWHHGPKGEPTAAVFKSVVRGRTYYTTNTHRAYNTTPSLDDTIDRYHDFIKGTE